MFILFLKSILKKQTWILLIVYSLTTNAYAEVIVLKNGQKIEGKILQKNALKIRVEFEGVALTYVPEEVESIDGIVQEAPLPSPKEEQDFPAAPNDAKSKRIVELLDAFHVKGGSNHFEHNENVTIYNSIISAFSKAYDERKISQLMEWKNSELGKKIFALQQSPLYLGAASEMLNPLSVYSSVLLSNRRKELLQQIKAVQINLSIKIREEVLNKSLDSINDVLDPAQRMQAQERE